MHWNFARFFVWNKIHWFRQIFPSFLLHSAVIPPRRKIPGQLYMYPTFNPGLWQRTFLKLHDCEFIWKLQCITIDTDCPMAFQIIKISNFVWEKPPRSPSGTPNRCSHDSLVFKKYPNFTYSKGWTVCWSITNEGYSQTNLGTCDLFPVAMMSFTSVASILLETLINTWTSASPSSRQSASKKKYDRLRKATW